MPTGLRLSLLDRSRRRRRRPHRNHGTTKNRSRRLDRHWPSSTNHAGANRLSRHYVTYRRGGDFPGAHFHHVLRHRPRVHESVARHYCHSVGHALIDVGDVVNRRSVDDHRVVDVRHLRNAHRCIRDVHIVHIGAAHAISRQIDLAWCEREPPHANAGGEAETRAAAHERDQRRSPDGTHHHWPRHPKPSIVYERPASIVEWRESPGLIPDPGPAPGPEVDPVTEAIRSPTRHDGARPPTHTVAGNVTPVAVVVQIFVAGHLAGNIIRGVGVFFLTVAIERPAIEIILVGKLAEVIIEMI